MCGIAGLIAPRPIFAETGWAMADALAHRGPDDRGLWTSDDGHVALGHRRLAILDLSSAGHQPMTSFDERYVTVYNGEIYNFRSLRRDLETAGAAPAWRGHSDTEVLLAAIAHWGFADTLARLEGMFAIALWDKAERRLSLARDRFGEKPLYYGWTAAGFAFGSELKALTVLPGFDNPIDPAALRVMLGRGYIPAPLSIYRGIFKLEPGTWMSITTDAAQSHRRSAPTLESSDGLTIQRYYDHADVVAAGAAQPFSSYDAAKQAVGDSLAGAIEKQLVADVGVGAFLSGGIDSSLITALAARASDTPVKTFTLGFREADFDEAGYARRVAAHLGTDHYEHYVGAEDALAVIPSLAQIYDEPFADSSQIPTHLVSHIARAHVTVALSGDAGDELFGGYNRHRYFPSLWRKFAPLPLPVRQAGNAIGGPALAGLWVAAARVRGARRPRQLGERLRTALAIFARSRDFDGMVGLFLDHWSLGEDPVAADYDRSSIPPLAIDPALRHLPLETGMMALDASSYLPGDILCKVDRAAMAVSLETRVPFLDPHVAAAAARMPAAMQFDRRGGKRVLRDLLGEHVPRDLFERPKAGFAIPVGEWLRGPLRYWAEDLLSVAALGECGLLNPAPIRQRWQRHLSGHSDATEALWPVLMFQAWNRAR
ncbi:asparagine synthase (glutamine-hydrolyzing) [Sphingorhabdus soli]|uniref:asparagine synthase (glutamine-hydrolyzing) n=2 Tax=Flavisphingopyxis soli TaxID=2601267 RepID=A0A5C6UU36_9SPHN|nr:asparagine synthase (glutamine-hydrolyzing) [Sphingorhabdus soli]